MSDHAANWHTFLAAIAAWNAANQSDLAAMRKLADAASAYAYAASRAERRPQPTGVADHRDDEVVFRFGKLKGSPVRGAAERDLEWYIGALKKSIDDPDKARFRDANIRHLGEIEAEQ